jgi:hypothetical protein
MALRIPANKIIESKYTTGDEFILEFANIGYVGYYYELNNNLYAGKTFDSKAPKLILIKDRNTLLDRNNSLAVFSAISGITSQQLQTPNFSSLPTDINNYAEPEGTPKFYCKKLNNQPILIKEISEDDFNMLQSNPIYQTLRIDFKSSSDYKSKIAPDYIEQAEQQMPGITSFLYG